MQSPNEGCYCHPSIDLSETLEKTLNLSEIHEEIFCGVSATADPTTPNTSKYTWAQLLEATIPELHRAGLEVDQYRLKIIVRHR